MINVERRDFSAVKKALILLDQVCTEYECIEQLQDVILRRTAIQIL
jgi:hypothetical protein